MEQVASLLYNRNRKICGGWGWTSICTGEVHTVCASQEEANQLSSSCIKAQSGTPRQVPLLSVATMWSALCTSLRHSLGRNLLLQGGKAVHIMLSISIDMTRFPSVMTIKCFQIMVLVGSHCRSTHETRAKQG